MSNKRIQRTVKTPPLILVVVQKMNEKFYQARDAIENGSYLKANIRTLRRYRTELKRPQAWENDPRAAFATSMKAGWIANLDKAIEKKKYRRRAFYRRVLIGVLIGTISAVLAYIAVRCLSSLPLFSEKTHSTTQNKKQEIHQKAPDTTISPATNLKTKSEVRTLLPPKIEPKTDTKPAQQVNPADRYAPADFYVSPT